PNTIRIQVAAPADLWRVPGNATHLQQMMINLCINFRDTMPDGGILTIEVANDCFDPIEKRVVIRIADTSAGMPRETSNRVVEPLWQTKDLDRLNGLGLYTVGKIVANHRGSLEFSSEPGQGTQFRIYLPADSSNPQLSAGEESHA